MKKTALFVLMLCIGQALTIKAQNTDVSGIKNVVYITPFSAQSGTQATLSINMKNTAAIRGFQFDLYLPEGVTIGKSAKGKILCSLNPARLPEDDAHTIMVAEQENGTFRFLVNSMDDETFTGNDGEVISVTINLAETMADGDYPILLENIKLSESDISKYYTTESVLSTLTVVNDVTGIQSVSANKATKSIYNLAGQKMKNTRKGVNIVDGKKVLVK